VKNFVFKFVQSTVFFFPWGRKNKKKIKKRSFVTKKLLDILGLLL